MKVNHKVHGRQTEEENSFMKRINECLKIVFILVLVTNISACSIYSKDFDCKYEKGVGCKSISEVNHMVNKGQLRSSVEDKTLPEPLHASVSQSSKPITMSDKGMIQRVQEEHLRVWIAPFQDEQGNFHEASVVHTVMKPGYWQLLEKS